MSDLTLTNTVTNFEPTQLSAIDKAKALEIAKGISIDDSQAIVQFGIGAQNKISSFAQTMLTQIKVKDSGEVGESLVNLVFKIKEVDVGSLTNPQKGLFAFLINSVQRFIARYEKLETQIQRIVEQLGEARMTLLKDITMLDQLFEKNLEYIHELDLYLYAGELKLEELKKTVLPDLEKKAKTSSDALDAQKFNDFQQFIERFERKLHDLKLSRVVALQTAPQVRLIQNNNQALVEKIQSSILTTIPLWKSQVVIAISLLRQKKALGIQKTVTDATNELLTKNSELLKSGTIEVAKESERGIVEIETLKKVNADLISTIEETIQIQQQGKLKRTEAEKELQQIEFDLKNKLANARAVSTGE